VLLGRVIGDVVSTVKEPCYAGRKLLWVQPIDLSGKPKGDAFITIDVVGAGPPELVLVLQEGGGAQQVLGCRVPSPIGSAIVAIVDESQFQEAAQ
jgi:ethanolamine utilization protein EutN